MIRFSLTKLLLSLYFNWSRDFLPLYLKPLSIRRHIGTMAWSSQPLTLPRSIRCSTLFLYTTISCASGSAKFRLMSSLFPFPARRLTWSRQSSPSNTSPRSLRSNMHCKFASLNSASCTQHIWKLSHGISSVFLYKTRRHMRPTLRHSLINTLSQKTFFSLFQINSMSTQTFSTLETPTTPTQQIPSILRISHLI